jgi:poly-gamma-glutamate synthesis protein (capsule biosynthesis protein)
MSSCRAQSKNLLHSAGATTLVFSSCLILIPLVAVLLLLRPATSNPPNLSTHPWLYLRDDQPLAPKEDAIELIAVGDVMLGRGVAEQPHPFEDVAPWLRRADLAVGNLECVMVGKSIERGRTPLTGRSPRSCRCEARSDEAISAIASVSTPHAQEQFLRSDSHTRSLLQAAPSAVTHLRRTGFDVLGLANNHALDLGPEGLAETASHLSAGGIVPLGVGPDPEAAIQPLIREVGGVRLALLAFNAVPDARVLVGSNGWALAEWDTDRASAAVAAARELAHAVIVSVHWGYEYETSADPAQRDAARALLAAGADLVLGHHPHVVQAVEVQGDRCVAYSLGNFVFDQARGETDRGLALRAFFDRGGLRAVQALPVWAGPRPRLMTSAEAHPLLARVAPPPRRIGFACDDQTCRRVAATAQVVQDVTSGLFWGGQIDLTGDGVPEHVRRVGESVVVYSDGAQVWRSHPEWRVVDVALGDPNDDGRGELLLALWKVGLDGLEMPGPEKERVPRSHPFIVGYRGGTYRTLWGGSAVESPIREVELADVAGDGAQELIVLEGDEGHGRAVSVWRWHGWGFSLMWRSEPGAYRDLVLVEDGAISVVVE